MMAGNNLSRRAEDVVGYREVSQASIKWANTQISQMQGAKPAAVGDGTLSFEGRRVDIRLPWVATYAGFVQSADIQVHLSSAVKLNSTKLEASGNVPFQLDHVALLPVATGFDSHPSLALLPWHSPSPSI
jgi:hypothetical protein